MALLIGGGVLLAIGLAILVPALNQPRGGELLGLMEMVFAGPLALAGGVCVAAALLGIVLDVITARAPEPWGRKKRADRGGDG